MSLKQCSRLKSHQKRETVAQRLRNGPRGKAAAKLNLVHPYEREIRLPIFLRRIPPTTTRPEPNNARLPGSGIGWIRTCTTSRIQPKPTANGGAKTQSEGGAGAGNSPPGSCGALRARLGGNPAWWIL